MMGMRATYHVDRDAAAVIVGKDVVRRTRAGRVGPRKKEDKVEGQAELRAQRLGVPVPRLELLRQPEQEVHWIEHGLDPLGPRRPSDQARHREELLPIRYDPR